ncbi:MAG: tetratricopeptide repeat protein [Gammaproteobacteria bacterium]
MPLLRPRLSRLALCLAAALATPAYADDLLQQADQLLSQQKGAEAYALLAPQEDLRAGDPDYDVLLGRAALASSRHTEAAFAFERCLAVDPKNGPCRINMAQAHMLMGETESARLELKTIEQYSPPPEVQALVSQYMGLLATQEQKKERQVQVFAQLALGHDSNVNSATDARQVAIPLFGNLLFDMLPGSREQDDNYAQLEAGASLRQSLSPAWSLLADASVSQRQHQDIDALDSLILQASAGGAWRTGASQVVLKATAQDYQLDGDDYRQILGGMVQYIHSPSDITQVSAFLQVADIGYDT